MIGPPEHLRRSLTWDRDTEMARYDKIQLALELPVYFCDPHSRWQRGSEESTNPTCHLIVQQTRVGNDRLPARTSSHHRLAQRAHG